MKTLSIILPTRNEEQLIESTIKSIVSFLNQKKYDYEILVILNGSTDKTENIVNKLKQNNKSINTYKSKPGYGYALRKGLKIAKGKYLLIYNVDFFDLELINLVDINMYGKDFIIGSKRAHWSTDERPISRKIVSFIFNTYLAIFYGFRGSDTHGIKLMKRRVLDKIFSECKTYSGIFDTELVIRTQRAGFEIADFPVDIKEVRPSRFVNRLIQTPIDIYNLYKALNK